MAAIALLVPVLGRPERVGPLLESFRAATNPFDVCLYFIVQTSDEKEISAIRRHGANAFFVQDTHRSWAKKINVGARYTSEPWILLGADDLNFIAGWFDVARPFLQSHDGFVLGTNDLGNESTMNGTSSTHPLVSRSYMNTYGTVDEKGLICHEGYDHNFTDTELVLTAQRRERYLHLTECKIEHLHPLWGKATMDETYRLGAAHYQDDRTLFERRRAQFRF